MSEFVSGLEKVGTALAAVAIVLGILLIVFFLAARTKGKAQGFLAGLVFLGPAVLLLLYGLVVPAVRTTAGSFQNAEGTKFVGLANYGWIFTAPGNSTFLINTVLWIVVAPVLSTALGLTLALLLDRMRRESISKSLIFMPMAISFVGASIIWKFVYTYQPDPNKADIGLLSAIFKAIGLTPPNWLLEAPLNTFLLIAVMVWIQTGFAMVVLSAAMKAVPDDIIEASMLDGAKGWARFTRITIPMIWGSVIVVLTTITVTSLKVFDIIRTMTGGNFQTSVIANEMYQQSFRALNYGTGSALAMILFLGVLPLIIFNVRQVRKEREVH